MRSLLLAPLFFCFHSFGQNFVISDSLYTETTENTYHFHFFGNATFNDSIKIVYAVKSMDSTGQILLTDSVDFSANPLVFPSTFSQNQADSTFAVDLGTYPTKEVILEIYSQINGENKEYILINIPNLESFVENEE